MSQRPPVPGPHPLDAGAVHAWTAHRVAPIPEAAAECAAPGPGVMRGLLEGSQSRQPLRGQLLSERRAPVVAVPHDDARPSRDPRGHDRGLMASGRGEAKAHDDPGPSDQHRYAKAAASLAPPPVVAEGPLATEARAPVGPRARTDGEGQAVKQWEGGIQTGRYQQTVPE